VRCLSRAGEKGASRKSAVRIAANVLTKAAIDRGSKDNVTVVIVDLKPQGSAPSSKASIVTSKVVEPAPAPEPKSTEDVMQTEAPRAPFFKPPPLDTTLPPISAFGQAPGFSPTDAEGASSPSTPNPFSLASSGIDASSAIMSLHEASQPSIIAPPDHIHIDMAAAVSPFGSVGLVEDEASNPFMSAFQQQQGS
jgi:hypothetical protein